MEKKKYVPIDSNQMKFEQLGRDDKWIRDNRGNYVLIIDGRVMATQPNIWAMMSSLHQDFSQVTNYLIVEVFHQGDDQWILRQQSTITTTIE